MSLLDLAVASDSPWKQLAPIPDAEGFAGSFAGVSGDALIFAGGANIVGEKWGETFTKKWYDHIFVLERPDGEWKRAGKLDAPLGYGVSITARNRDALICIGGSNEAGHTDDVFELRWRKGQIVIERNLPKLPRPIANACGVLVRNTIYLAGGIERPDATKALHIFLALDLAAEKPTWQELPPWPGPERMLGVAAVGVNNSFYLLSGASLAADANGKPVRTYLRDAWAYGEGRWRRLPDLPRPAVAAASPATDYLGLVLIFSGDDGASVDFDRVEKHPGFPREVLSFDYTTNRWTRWEDPLPFSRATVPSVPWLNMIVIPNGEVRPRVRTNEVWALQ